MRRRERERGFALLIVLWLLAPLALLLGLLAQTARQEAQLSRNLGDAAGLEAAADGAINTVIFTLLQRRSPAAAGSLRTSRAETTVEVASLGGLVNPNTVSAVLLRAVLMRLGAHPAEAERLAAAIVDWRTPGQRARPNGAKAAEYRAAGLDYGPPGGPFETLDELGDVLGMTPRLAAALRPYLTLYADGEPDPDLAPGLVKSALDDLGVRGRGGAQAGELVRITATAWGPGGERVVREAVVKIGYSANGRGWRVLTWTTRDG